MKRETFWIPDFEILKLIYNKRSIVHGIDHILRVWIYAQLITNNINKKIDVKVLSTACLLHDVGRKNDFTDKNHGLTSANWVKDFLLILDNSFSEKQIEEIAQLCKQHNLSDTENMSIELKILKDADALDRERLPLKKLDIKYLRLKQSKELVPLTSSIFHIWKKKQCLSHNNKETLYFIMQKFELPLRSNFMKDKSSDNKFLIKHLEKELASWSKYCTKLKDLIYNGKLNDTYLKKIHYLSKSGNNINIQNTLLKKVFLYKSSIYIKNGLRLALNDFTYNNQTRDILIQIYKEQELNLRIQEIDNKDLLSLLLELNSLKTVHIKNGLIEILSIDKNIKRLIFSCYILKHKRYHLFKDSIRNTRNITHLFPVNYPLKEVSASPNFWITFLENCIDTVIEDNMTLSRKLFLLEYCTSFISLTFEHIFLYPKECLRLTNILCKILNITITDNIFLNISKIKNIFGDDYKIPGIITFKEASVKNYANIFNIYDGLDSSIKECIDSQIQLINLLSQKGKNISVIKSNYIRNLSLLKKQLEKPQISYSNRVKSLTKNSVKNYETILKSLRIRQDLSFPNDSNDFKLIMNVINFSTLEKIINGSKQLLAIQNIINKKNLRKSTDRYFENIKYRDIVQRTMTIRNPNCYCSQPIYGSLENIENIKKKGLSEYIKTRKWKHSIKNSFVNKRYGNIILVFKKSVLKKSIFVFFDSLWSFRKHPISFEEAVKLRTLLYKRPLLMALRNHPLSYPTAYIEAIILGGGITLKDVEKIIAPQKEIQKNKKIIKKLKEEYPEIEIVSL